MKEPDVFGPSAAIAALATYRGLNAGGAASMLAGVLLMGFIAVEVAILNQPTRWTGTEVVYFATGLAMLVLGYVALRSQAREGLPVPIEMIFDRRAPVG